MYLYNDSRSVRLSKRSKDVFDGGSVAKRVKGNRYEIAQYYGLSRSDCGKPS